jgi:hypothetical protein
VEAMRLVSCFFVGCFFAVWISFAAPPQHATDVYAPLRAYNGTWQVSASTKAAGAKPDVLVNQCLELGKFFACGQIINGQSGGLIVFIAKGEPGHYATQTIRPEGRATGLAELQVSGNTWTYMNRRDEYGKTTFYRTLNVFTGKDRIHYEQAHSPDQKQWTVDGSGDEVRIAAK